MFGIDLDFEDFAQTVVQGVAGGVGFAFGGPVGGALLGGAVSGLWSAAETGFNGGSFGDAMSAGLESALVGGALGAIPGGFAGGGARGLLSGLREGGEALVTRGIGMSFKGQWARSSMTRLGLGSTTAGLATGLGNQVWDRNKPLSYADQLPTKIIEPQPEAVSA
ncbi:hypothetical protein OH799_31380 [Nocardia sp. NBC_00881]|uniref:hypothetical protein n=1 Tax=Nocardia sp. NBC_00881 TaxID=2975995 RepID=UPI00386AA4E0|nr:hypothetical protein OH799_31380 [Nocardia sp. NBC_00881]